MHLPGTGDMVTGILIPTAILMIIQPGELCFSGRSSILLSIMRTTSSPTFIWTTKAVKNSNISKARPRSEEHTSELQSRGHLVCRLLLEKKKKKQIITTIHE